MQSGTSAKRRNNETQPKREVAQGRISSAGFHSISSTNYQKYHNQSKFVITRNESENWFADSATNKVHRSTLNNKQNKIKLISGIVDVNQ
jgi:hypothetical protein